jgi:hypothetical protein
MPDEPLFGGRLSLDSVDSLQWAAAVEQRYRCALSDRDIARGALESLGQTADTLLAQGIAPGAALADDKPVTDIVGIARPKSNC